MTKNPRVLEKVNVLLRDLIEFAFFSHLIYQNIILLTCDDKFKVVLSAQTKKSKYNSDFLPSPNRLKSHVIPWLI